MAVDERAHAVRAPTGWWLAGHATLRRRLRRLPAGEARRPHAGLAPTPAAPGCRRRRRVAVHSGCPPARTRRQPSARAVLFDRDGTLVVDVPYNGDPARVQPVPGARAALERLRAAGVPTAVVSNQSGIARGLVTPAQVGAVNDRIDQLLGPLGPWAVCPHAPADGCGCRKPAPGLVLDAAARLGVDPAGCVVIGDIGADVEAARAAGARGILVPTDRTRREEVEAAGEVAADLAAAVELALRPAPVAAAVTCADAVRCRPCHGRRGVTHVLAVRLDNDGDVLLAGPAIRALAHGAGRVTLLHGPRGRRGAALLPGVDDRLVWRAPWIDPEPRPVDAAAIEALVAGLAALGPTSR
jgi:HAD superfamily hydrolase (TIGR01662 family)